MVGSLATRHNACRIIPTEQTLIYRLIEQYYPHSMQWKSEGRLLPNYVRRDFEEYPKCGCFELSLPRTVTPETNQFLVASLHYRVTVTLFPVGKR